LHGVWWGNLENIHFRDMYGDREGNCTIDLEGWALRIEYSVEYKCPEL